MPVNGEWEQLEYTALMTRGRDAEKTAQICWTAAGLGAAVLLSWGIAAKSASLMLPVVFAAAYGYYATIHSRQQTRLIAGYVKEFMEGPSNGPQWFTRLGHLEVVPGFNPSSDWVSTILVNATVALAHIAFCIGFVAIVVRARMAGMDESLVEAARDCGATPLQAFTHVTLPLIMPGVIAGALMAFTLSIDDFVITFFTAGAGTVTLPLQIYSMIKIAVTPEVNAVSTLLMLLTLLLIVIASKISPSLLRSK